MAKVNVKFEDVSQELKEKLEAKGFKIVANKMFCQMKLGAVILEKEFIFDEITIWNNKYAEFRLNKKNIMSANQEITL